MSEHIIDPDRDDTQDYSLEYSLGRGKRRVYLYFYGGAPSTEQMRWLVRQLSNQNEIWNGEPLEPAARAQGATNGHSEAAMRLPGPPVVVNGERPRNGNETGLHVRRLVKELKPPCQLHPELGPVDRSPYTNRCPICDGERLASSRIDTTYVSAPTPEQREQILGSYPKETMEQIHRRLKIPYLQVRDTLVAAGIKVIPQWQKRRQFTDEEINLVRDMYSSGDYSVVQIREQLKCSNRHLYELINTLGLKKNHVRRLPIPN